MALVISEELALETRLAEILNRRATGGLALGVVRNRRLDWFHGHGLANIASRTPVTEDTAFRIASISKTFTAVAVMQLVERGLVDLDAPATDYLRAYRLVPAKPTFRPPTIRHLLTHTSGIGELQRLRDLLLPTLGSEVRKPPVPSLAEYYRSGLRVEVEPGTRFAYSDHGFATVGQIVEDVSGEPFGRYLRERVFAPLGMESTDVDRERVLPRLATGYVIRRRGLRPVADRGFALGGAGAVYSTTRDMARYVGALLGGGANEHGSVLEPEAVASMFDPHYRPDPHVPGIGLAFFRAEAGGRRFVEHGGILPGFSSQLFLAPDDGIGVLAFANVGSPAPLWLPFELAGVLRGLLGVPDVEVRRDIPQHPEVWGDICGWYGLPAGRTGVRAMMMTGAAVEVFARRGRLLARGLSPIPGLLRGLPLHPDDEDDPYVFRIDLSEFGFDSCRVAFSRAPETGAWALHLDLHPLSLHKLPHGRDPARWTEGALVLGTAALAAHRVRRYVR
ncbi:MAG TPA: serine hydrolase domain-containing protein [Gaiellaceae bacterium]|nr:serine hydrolase domain-containing protein [Gaiellaceae bacterium]